MKRAFVLIIIAVLLGCLCLPINASTEPKNLVILGDSIAAGHSLPDFDSEGDPKSALSWSTLLAEAYGAKQYNLAIGGHTTSDLFAEIQAQRNGATLAKADVICLSIGGNNFLQLMGSSFGTSGFSKEAIEAAADTMLTAAATDLDAIFDALKTKIGSETEVLVQTLYNPYRYFTVVLFDDIPLGDWMGDFIDRYNTVLKQRIEHHGFRCIDVAAAYEETDSREYLYASFESGNAVSALLALPQADPHPTEAGHRAIFDAYVNAAGAVLEEALCSGSEDDTSTSPSDSMTEDTVETTSFSEETADDSLPAETSAGKKGAGPEGTVFLGIGLAAVLIAVLFAVYLLRHRQ